MAPARVDYYAMLGVPRLATAEQLRKAYRRKALEHHPDKNLGHVLEATESFKRVAEAYSVLRDPAQRARYDRADGTAVRGFSVQGAMDLFRDVFGEEITAGLTRVADEVVRPKVQRAAAPLISGFTSAVDRCSKAEVVRDAMAAGLGSIASEADAELQMYVRSQERCLALLEESREKLTQHEVQHRARMSALQRDLDEADQAVHRWTAYVPLLLISLQLAGMWAGPSPSTAFIVMAWLATILFVLDGVARWRMSMGAHAGLKDAERQFAANSVPLQEAVKEAERALRVATDALRRAQAAAAKAQEDLRTSQRDGASLGAAATVGRHICGKVMRFASETLASPRLTPRLLMTPRLLISPRVVS